MTARPRALRRARFRDATMYWVYIPGAVIGSGLAADRLAALPKIHGFAWIIPSAALLMVIGTGVIQKATRDLAVFGQGTPNPETPPKRLVTQGIYALCRHPMFFGYDLTALGIVLLFRSPAMLFLSYPLLLLLQRRFLRREETRVLLRRFGPEFEAYRRKVPFLFPAFKRPSP